MPDVPRTIGPYRVLGRLGQGAMGTVYRAEDPLLGRIVAIKTIQIEPGLDPELEQQMRMRFAREARSAASLTHPNIITIHYFGEHEGQPYLVMELVDGWSLETLLRSGEARNSMAPLLAELQRAARALDYAHSRGIVHRDIKPANILVGRDKVFKIADFGIARLVGATKLTATGSPIGTPQYLAPECLRGAPAGPAADQYALGIVAYEIVTQSVPFTADTAEGLFYQILNEPPPSVRTFDSTLRRAVDLVFQRVLAKDPAERFGTCEEFADRLVAALSAPATPQEPPLVEKKKASPAEPVRVAKPGRRSRILILTVCGLLAAALIVVGVLYLVEHQEVGESGFRVPQTLAAITLSDDLPPPPIIKELPPPVAAAAHPTFPDSPESVTGPRKPRVGMKLWNPHGVGLFLEALGGDGTYYVGSSSYRFWAIRDGRVQWGFEGVHHFHLEATPDGRVWAEDTVFNRDGVGGKLAGSKPPKAGLVPRHELRYDSRSADRSFTCQLPAGVKLDHQCENGAQEQGVTYLATVTKNLYAFNRDRTRLWVAALPCRSPLLMIPRNGLVVLGCRATRDWVAESIYGVRDGHVAWTFKTDDNIVLSGFSNPWGFLVDRNGTSYFVDTADFPHLYAVDHDGHLLWKYSLGRFRVHDLALDSHGRLMLTGTMWVDGDNGAMLLCFSDTSC